MPKLVTRSRGVAGRAAIESAASRVNGQMSCSAPFADCDGRAENGCEADLTSSEHCGSCGAHCAFAHAVAGCAKGTCVLAACQAGHADCDGMQANGCERALDSTASCGACGLACPAAAPHASSVVCAADGCIPQCVPGFGDCNALLSDGCELALTSDGNCGACGMGCKGPHVSAAECRDGRCTNTRCVEGFADCNDDPRDGCETNLLDPNHCGSCDARCRLPHTTSVRCDLAQDGSGTQCLIDRSCQSDELDCTITRRRGCELNYADCDGDPSNGCEADLRRSDNCGGCSISCVSESELQECRSDSCVQLGCTPGHARCAGMRCISLLDDPANCGACGHACPERSPRCFGGRCTGERCSAGSADCDDDTRNACESSMNDRAHCGGCDLPCGDLPHVNAVECRAGKCQIGTCQRGFADCDRDPNNGCEIAVDTLDDCGGCGVACVLPQAQAGCQDGKCQVERCSAGRADCNGLAADGCEDDLRSAQRCGSCDHDCTALPHVASASCEHDTCRVQCATNFADCDGDPRNGCESDLTSGSSCGSCDIDCGRLPNVERASCSAGMCGALDCAPGFGDCNALSADGCERQLNREDDCGACGQRCQPVHAAAECTTGECRHRACEPGYDDCDGNAANGCESALDTPSHCGGCGIACERGAPCKNGKCGCVRDAACAPGEQCCNNECIDTVGSCYPWPCIPGTDRASHAANCGGCGMACPLWCCGPLL